MWRKLQSSQIADATQFQHILVLLKISQVGVGAKFWDSASPLRKFPNILSTSLSMKIIYVFLIMSC